MSIYHLEETILLTFRCVAASLAAYKTAHLFGMNRVAATISAVSVGIFRIIFIPIILYAMDKIKDKNKKTLWYQCGNTSLHIVSAGTAQIIITRLGLAWSFPQSFCVGLLYTSVSCIWLQALPFVSDFLAPPPVKVRIV